MEIEDLARDSIDILSHVALIIVYRSRVYKPKDIPVYLFDNPAKRYFRKPLDVAFGCRKVLLDFGKVMGNDLIYRRCYLIENVLVIIGFVHGISLKQPLHFRECKNSKALLIKKLQKLNLLKTEKKIRKRKDRVLSCVSFIKK